MSEPLLQLTNLETCYGLSQVLHGISLAIADRITVLVYGRIIASGTPEAIRANQEVRQAYLGEQEAVQGAGHG